MAQLKLRKQFESIGLTLRQALSNNVKRSVGIDGAAYSPPAESTLASRRAKKSAKTGKQLKSSTSTKRLLVTTEFAGNAFEYVASDTGVKVFAKNDAHRSGVPFSDILRYNSRGQREVNKHIKNPPLVFPTNKSEVMKMQDGSKPVLDKIRRDLEKEVLRQLKEMGNMNLKVQLNIG